MAGVGEFTLESVRDFMITRGGKVTNHELVQHFAFYLTKSENKDLARSTFKVCVNTLATISQEGGEKFLILKRKYRVGSSLSLPIEEDLGIPSPPPLQRPDAYGPSVLQGAYSYNSPRNLSPASQVVIPPPYRAPPPYRPPVPRPSLDEMAYRHPWSSPERYPPLERRVSSGPMYGYDEPPDLGIPPPPPLLKSSSSSSLTNTSAKQPSIAALRPTSLSLTPQGSDTSLSKSSDSSTHTPAEGLPPPLPPRKQQVDKENLKPSLEVKGATDLFDAKQQEEDRKVSVKEATQRFNRMASEIQLSHLMKPAHSKANRNSRTDREDYVSVSVHSYGPEGPEWMVAAARSDFQEILRLLKINHKLCRHRDVFNTALHWAAKQGRPEVIKLLAGTYHMDVNAKSNGGYTPLHLAAMFNRNEVFDLLLQYKADINQRDYSGKKPRQYFAPAYSTLGKDATKKLMRRNSVKEVTTSFLRMGSLNQKVRRTTEAFNSLFSDRDQDNKLQRTWGSSDSLTDSDIRLMPPPKFGPIKKRKMKKDSQRPHSVATVEEEDSPGIPHGLGDSDSDSAYGFGSEWH